MQYHRFDGKDPGFGEGDRDQILETLGGGLPAFAPGGHFLFCFRRVTPYRNARAVDMVWFESREEGISWLRRESVRDCLSGTTEEFAAALCSRRKEPLAPAVEEGIRLTDPEGIRTIIGSILLLVVAFFSWNFREFFGPDSIYYFARKVDYWPDIVKAFSSIDDRGHYRPMGMLLFTYIFFPAFKYSAVGHHLVPLLFHGANTVIAYAISRRLLPSPTAVLAATAFFALHRINFFVTFGITFIPDFTGVFFFLAAFLCYLKQDEHRGWLGASMVLWICALFSKESAVVLPVILTGYELLIARKENDLRRIFRRCLHRGLPFWTVACAFAALLIKLRGGSLYPDNSADPYAASLTLGTLLPKAKYLWWGLNLPQGSRITSLLGISHLLPDVPIQRPYPYHTSVAVLLMMPFVIMFALFLFRGILRRDRITIFGVLYFLAALSPVLLLAGRVMHHNLYFALLGLALLFGLFADFIGRTAHRGLLLPLTIVFLLNTGIGVVNNRRDSWPVLASHASADYLGQFRAAVARGMDCETTDIVIGRTGQTDIVWHTDGGNLFRVFGPCPYLRVHFEDLESRMPARRSREKGPQDIRLELKASPAF